jgi:hypothetical protein
VHYAALDAYAVLVVWEKLTKMRESGEADKFYQKHNLLTSKGYAKLTQERKDNRDKRLKLKELEFHENIKANGPAEKLESESDAKEPLTVKNTQLQVPNPPKENPPKNSKPKHGKDKKNYKFPHSPFAEKDSDWVSKSESHPVSKQVSQQNIDLGLQTKVPTFEMVLTMRDIYVKKVE